MARPARLGTAAALLLGLAAAFAPVPRQRAPLRAAPLFAKETLQDKIYAWQDQFIASLTKDDKAEYAAAIRTSAPAKAEAPAEPLGAAPIYRFAFAYVAVLGLAVAVGAGFFFM